MIVKNALVSKVAKALNGPINESYQHYRLMIMIMSLRIPVINNCYHADVVMHLLNISWTHYNSQGTLSTSFTILDG